MSELPNCALSQLNVFMTCVFPVGEAVFRNGFTLELHWKLLHSLSHMDIMSFINEGRNLGWYKGYATLSNAYKISKQLCLIYSYLNTSLFLLLLFSHHHSPGQQCDEFTDLNLGHAFIGTNIRIRLLLYTRENSTCGTLLSHTDLSDYPQFSLSKTTTFIVHGYRPTGSPPAWVNDMTELLLARDDMNIIVVDWNYGATNLNYLKAVENTKKAAANLTAFIEMMQVWRISDTLCDHQCHWNVTDCCV